MLSESGLGANPEVEKPRFPMLTLFTGVVANRKVNDEVCESVSAAAQILLCKRNSESVDRVSMMCISFVRYKIVKIGKWKGE